MLPIVEEIRCAAAGTLAGIASALTPAALLGQGWPLVSGDGAEPAHEGSVITQRAKAMASGTEHDTPLAVMLPTKIVDFLGRLVTEEKAHPKLRLEAAKTLLDRGRYVAPRAPAAPEIGRKNRAAMSIEELQGSITEGSARLAEERLIDITPTAAASEPPGE